MILKESLAFLIFCSFLGVNGQFSILRKPDYVQFVESSHNLQSFELPQVVFNLFGLPNAQLTKWDGLLVGNLFKRPKAVVLISVASDRPITLQHSQISYEMIENSGDLNTEYIQRRLQGIDWIDPPLIIDTSVDNMLLDVKASYDQLSSTKSLESILNDLHSSHWLENHKTGSLNLQSDADLLFLGEIFSITQTIDKIKNSGLTLKHAPSFLSFQVSSLTALSASSAHADASLLLNHVIREATEQLSVLYDGNVVIATVRTSPGNDDNNLRLGRQLRQAANDTEVNAPINSPIGPVQAPAPAITQAKGFNKAPHFSPMYPVIFNIILWMSVVLVLSLIWISWSIWYMDPGKDSVIYRMTTQRLKRD